MMQQISSRALEEPLARRRETRTESLALLRPLTAYQTANIPSADASSRNVPCCTILPFSSR